MLSSFALFLATLALASSSSAASAESSPARAFRADTPVHYGAPAGATAAAAGDTLLLMGPPASGAAQVGTFEDAGGNPAWNGWTHVDLTQDTASEWHVDTFNAVSGVYSAWCGSYEVASCGQDDVDGGYGANYDEMLEWRGAVADPAQPCTVSVDALINIDTMYGYDYFHVSCEKADQVRIDLLSLDGLDLGLAIAAQTVYTPADYVGPDRDEVVILLRVTSDGGWDGADCLWPNDGAVQLDDLSIGLSNGAGYATDFEDGTLGDLSVRFPPGVGDFAHLWTGLSGLDPCIVNASPQAAFIDDGVVVPGTGGTSCTSWCYGPGGYIVNNSGGLALGYATLHNVIESPPLVWGDPGHDAVLLSYDAFLHSPATAGAPYIWSTFRVRWTGSGDPADLAAAPWHTPGFYYQPASGYYRLDHRYADFGGVVPTHFQVQLGVYQYVYDTGGTDGTPAPYYDNVRVATWTQEGPEVSAVARHQANDGFPASGGLDMSAPGSNSVRFDMAMNISPAEDGRNDPGDSVVIGVVPRAGAVLTGPPRFHYRLIRNELFDPYRSGGLPDVGSVACDSARAAGGAAEPNRWSVDLPDTGFLFPGDLLRWYFTATDDRGGDLRTTMMPADTSGFSRPYDAYFGHETEAYPSTFMMRALPGVLTVPGQPGVYTTPGLLLWHDSDTDEDWQEWGLALNRSCLLAGRDFDIFHTKEARNGLDNGLGGRATVAQLDSYADILYTSGAMRQHTLSRGEPYVSPADDVALLDAWLRLGGKDIFLAGDDLAYDLQLFGASFLGDWLGIEYVADEAGPLLDGVTSPLAAAVPGNPLVAGVGSWYAYGSGCLNQHRSAGDLDLRPRSFDAVRPLAGAERAAAFVADPGVPSPWEHSALTVHEVEAFDASVISMPVDFAQVWSDPDESAKADAPAAARDRLLADIIGYFGIGVGPCELSAAGDGDLPGGVRAARFAATISPNPFNPVTNIAYTVVRPGHLTVKIYDLRGRLVRTLLDGPVVQNGSAAWDGTDATGAAVASGVYFYEARLDGEVRVGKMALLK